MRTRLMTRELEKKAPPLGATEDECDPVAIARFFTPDSCWRWYLCEYDPETREAFGLVQGMEEELGLFNLSELESIRGPLGKFIERDPTWKPRRISEVKWS